MRVHHLNCISTCPLGGKLMDGRSESLRGKLTCHCLLVETGDSLVLIDIFCSHDVAEFERLAGRPLTRTAGVPVQRVPREAQVQLSP
jgi:hypothetical protein